MSLLEVSVEAGDLGPVIVLAGDADGSPAMVQGGRTVLVNPQEPVLKMLSHTRTAEMFTIQARTPAGTAPDTSAAGRRQETRASD